MWVQKMREEAAEKETDEHFNTIRQVIPMKQGRLFGIFGAS
jgi:hypothetical protein